MLSIAIVVLVLWGDKDTQKIIVVNIQMYIIFQHDYQHCFFRNKYYVFLRLELVAFFCCVVKV